MAILNAMARGCARPVWPVLCALLLACGTGAFAQAGASKEYQVKAAFLFNFAQFIEWPATVLTNADAPFRIGILGENPFGGVLEETVQGEAVKNHKIMVQHGQQVADLAQCQMIFISKSEKKRLPEILSGLGSAAVLTVSEMDGFAEHGGIINFYLEGKKVRFEINPAAARRGGLKFSSQLLSLGKIVEPGGGGQ